MGLSVQLYSDSSPTFAHPNKRDSSQIDYFLMSPSAADLVANPPTILCHDLDTSDHNPVTITINIPALPSCSPKTVASTRIVWNKMDKYRYQEVVISQLAVTPIKIQDTRYKKFISQSNDMYIIMYKCITEYYYDYNGNGRSTITYIGCLPDAPGKVIRYIKQIKWTKWYGTCSRIRTRPGQSMNQSGVRGNIY